MTGGVLVCGDLGSDRCGVGASEAAALAAVEPRPVVVDPRRVGATVRAVHRARGRDQPVVVAYPTRSTVRSARATVSLVATAVLGRGGLRWHLHEYALFRTRRLLLDALLVVGGGRVVVSTATEADVLRRSRRGVVGRRVEVRTVPPANGTPLAGPPPTTDGQAPARPPVVGLFGTARLDKGLDVAVAALRALPPDAAVETVGDGWDTAPWPPDLLAGRVVRHRGRLPTADLAPVLSQWSLAVAPFVDGATDGRMSLRTPLACGVPTLTAVTHDADLTLRPPHLLLADASDDAVDRALALAPEDRCRAAAAVATFERTVVRDLVAALWGDR